MKIHIAGDLVPTSPNIENFKNDNFIDELGESFKSLWLGSDFRLFNLECPLGEELKPIDKSGPNLLAPSSTINGIKSLKPDLICLSNNHILDYGIEGLENTLEILSKEDISNIGIINNSDEVAKTYYIEKDNIKVGIYNVCENEFSVATKNSKGANPMRDLKAYKEIHSAKQQCDYLIVIYHGGKEFYRYPSPELKKVCENFVDFGADIVITQHSHCIGALEEYNNSKILYGQGNFIFDSKDDEYWNTSLIVELTIDTNGIGMNYIPIERYNNLIRISENENILKDFEKRSNEIKDEEFLEKNYTNFAMNKLNEYLHISNGVRLYNRILNRLFKRKYFIKKYGLKDCLALLNIIECEAHRELFIKGLKEKINQYKKEAK